MPASKSPYHRDEECPLVGQFIRVALCILLTLSAFAGPLPAYAEPVLYRLALPSVGVNVPHQQELKTAIPIGKLRLSYQGVGGGIHSLDIDDPGFVRMESLDSAGNLVHYGEHYQAFSLSLSTADLGIAKLDSLSVYRATKSHGLQQLLSASARELSLRARPSARPDSYVVNVSDYINNGNGDLEVDIVVLGDGYTEAEAADFQEDATASVEYLLNEAPFSDFRDNINVRFMDVVSEESGADHPSQEIYVNTALGAYYDCSDIARLICIDNNEVSQYLNANIPQSQQDIVLVVVNDEEYGGSGGWLAVTSAHPSAAEVAVHEIGHSFGHLADEYEYGSCYNSYEPSQPNVTIQTSRSKIKWTYWIDSATVLPTSEGSQSVGLYEGAKYCEEGVYRPLSTSKMRDLFEPFGVVNEAALRNEIYNLINTDDLDIDLDGLANRDDLDDDNDGIPDADELSLGLNPLSVQDAFRDSDEDGASNLREFQRGTNMFDSESVPGAAVATDFDGDLRSDFLLHSDDGGLILQLGSGGESVLNIDLADNAQVLAVGDIDGDANADVLVRQESGEWLAYLMSGDEVLASAELDISINTNWAFMGLGDFNGDGRQDVLTRNSLNGRWAINLLDGLGASQTETPAGMAANQLWTFQGIADFNGDNKSDVLLRHQDSRAWFTYAMDGLTVLDDATATGATRLTTNPNWHFQGARDFNGDGKADVILRRSDGPWFMYPMNGLAHTVDENFGLVRITGNVDWAFQTLMDANASGFSDVLLRNQNNGTWFVYAFEGITRNEAGTGFLSLPVEANWELVTQ